MLELQPWQERCVAAYFAHGGAFVAMPVGAGKTTMAAAVAERCSRPVCLAPARGLPQIRRMFGDVPCAYRSHTAMCRVESEGWLEEERPTDIIVDEAHMLRNIVTNTAARRLNRHLIAHPAVRVLWMTGTPITRSVGDCVHGLRFALRSRAPVPTTGPGIAAFIAAVDSDPERQARFLAALRALPHVFIDSAPSYAGRIELEVETRRPALVPPDEAQYWERGPAAWGVRYTYDPPPSERLRNAAREWNHRVDALISAGACDTEEQARVVRPEHYAVYRAVVDAEPHPIRRVEWVDDSALREVLSSVGPGTLVWAHHQAVQARAAAILGCAREPGGAVAVLSIQSHSSVLNLQRYHTNIILEPPADASLLDQLIGRTARQGQTAPVVRVRFICAWPGAKNSLRVAIQRAKLIQTTTGSRSPLLTLGPLS